MADIPKVGDTPEGNFSKTRGKLVVRFTKV